MGGGSYSYTASVERSRVHSTKSTHEIFKQRNVNSAMNPYDLGIRESRDSEEHPESYPIIIALDVTGSMGSIPTFLVKEGFPNLMDRIIKGGIAHPQVLFLGIGDHECDSAPVQVGQFESSDELLEHWLTHLYIEGGGGGNDGESYLLAWEVAAYHTSIDSFLKRRKKGVLITIGDEKTLRRVPIRAQKDIFGEGQYSEETAASLLDRARETYECYHLHICQGASGRREDVKADWQQLMGDNLVLVEHKEDVDRIISEIVLKEYKGGTQTEVQTNQEQIDEIL